MQVSIDNIRGEIMSAIKSNDLVLPTMPEVALQLRSVADDPNSTVKDLAAVLGSDAALCARIIKVANSPLIRGVQVVNDIQMAVSRMGIPYTSNLALGVAMEQLFQATTEAVDDRMRETWAHSTEVAGICNILCRHFTSLRPDQATLAGLVHEIGKLPVLVWADYNDWGGGLIDSVIDKIHPELGRMILEDWGFPEELLDVPRGFSDFYRDEHETDYVDIVTVAALQSYAGTAHPYTNLDWSDIHAFENLGLDCNLVLADTEDMNEEFAAAKDFLS